MKRLAVYVKNSTWRLLIVLPATSKGRTGVAAPNQVSQDRVTAAENDHSLKHLISKLRNEDIKLILQFNIVLTGYMYDSI